jgi:DNA-binding NarL/FixJ family response regulator
LLILGPDLARIASTPQADRWLARLGSAPASGKLPTLVYALVARFRAQASSEDLAARTRLRMGDGRWLVLHAERLAGPSAAGQVAIMLEPARPPDLAPLLVFGHGLSARERTVAERVLKGQSTTQIASDLRITPYTVPDHVKAIFANVDVRSRHELGQALSARTGSLTGG